METQSVEGSPHDWETWESNQPFESPEWIFFKTLDRAKELNSWSNTSQRLPALGIRPPREVVIIYFIKVE